MESAIAPVKSKRIICTPSQFAKSNLLHLQEVGELQSIKPHISSRKGLLSFLFVVVTAGSGVLTYDGQKYAVSTGDCVFLDCRKSYSHYSAEDNLWRLKWMHFYGYNMNGIYEKYIERGGHPVFTPKSERPFAELLNDLINIADSEDYIRDMQINEKITSILTLIMSECWHPENNIQLGTKKQSLQHVKQYLEEHYKEKITLDSLSERFYINKFYLSRTFKNQFGMTVLSCLEQIRITHAKQLLRFTQLNIEQIGREVGIDEPGYFNRVFKKIEGNTPGKYRRMW